MYNLERIKKLEIIKVAKALNIDVKQKKAMCYNGHDKKSASLSFNLRNNTYKCFGCNDKGTVIDLVSKAKNLSVREAINWLGQNFNIIQNQTSIDSEISSLRPTNISQNGLEFSEIYEWFVNELTLSVSSRDYLKSRCISDQTIKAFNIKDINENQKIKLDGINRFGEKLMIESGLLEIKKNKQTNEKFTAIKFWNHIIFPFYEGKKVVYIQGRTLDPKYTKYLNLNNIAQSIYNKNIIETLNPNDTLYICEGIMDVISLYQLGKPSIGILGASSYKSKYTDLLTSFEIKVIAHNDVPGGTLFEKIKDEFLKMNKLVSRVYLPSTVKDVNDYLIMKQCKKTNR